MNGTAKNSTETSIETMSMGKHSAASAGHRGRATENPTYPQLPRSVAQLWGREPTTVRRGPKPSLTIRDIARAAVAIADERGWEAVSMKAIADSLGLSTMSLYRYVDGKDDVVDLLVDEAYGLPEPDLTASGTWRERISAWARAAATTLRTRPWITEIPMSRPPMGPNTISWTEAGVQAFDNVELSGQQKLNALLLVDGFVRQHVRQSTQMGLIGRGVDRVAADDPGRSGDSPSHDSGAYEATMLQLVDADRFPALTAAVSEMSKMSEDDDFFTEQFEFGLAVLLDGLEAMIERTRR